MNGILPIDKPSGMTSHDVVARVRRLAKTKRVGHAGTLDPDATGVLLVCVGSATRLADLLADGGKRYRCGLALGATTTTEDASGDVLEERDASSVTQAQLDAAIPDFLGDIFQVPPMVSAVHHEGKRLYELARAGVTVERAARPVHVESIVLEEFQPGEKATATLDIRCGKGTYIRTLCADVGAKLGVGGHMGWLRRTAVGPTRIDDCVPLGDLTPENIAGFVIPSARALGGLPNVVADAAQIVELAHGRTICAGIADADTVAVISAEEELIALVRSSGGILSPFKVFAAQTNP